MENLSGFPVCISYLLMFHFRTMFFCCTTTRYKYYIFLGRLVVLCYCCTRYVGLSSTLLRTFSFFFFILTFTFHLNPFSTAVAIWGQTMLIPSGLSPNRTAVLNGLIRRRFYDEDKPWSQVGVVPPVRAFIFIDRRVQIQHSHCSSICMRCC